MDETLDDDTSCIEAILSVTRSLPGVFTLVVRLDYETLEPITYGLAGCGYSDVSEADARSALYSLSWCGSDGTMLNPPDPQDQYVFWVPSGDLGCVATVSAKGGLPGFNATIIWAGTGQILSPDEWEPIPMLEDECAPICSIDEGRGYDLESGTPLSEEEVQQVLAELNRTLLPTASCWIGYVFSTVVLRYPRTIGAFDPTSAEWVVLISAGYLGP